jgi:hypothetical protein
MLRNDQSGMRDNLMPRCLTHSLALRACAALELLSDFWPEEREGVKRSEKERSEGGIGRSTKGNLGLNFAWKILAKCSPAGLRCAWLTELRNRAEKEGLMFRYATGLAAALFLAAPILAGELDKDFSAKAKQSGTAVVSATSSAMQMPAKGSELDREDPAQAWARGWRWGGWGWRGAGWGGWGWRGVGWRGWGWRGAGWRWGGGWGWRGWGWRAWPGWGWGGWGGPGWGWGGPSFWVSPGWGDCW